jgi:ferredoxin--NADP+ reductase
VNADFVAEARKKYYNSTLIWMREAHSDLRVMRVRSDFARPVHAPGQYCSLGLGQWEPRAEHCQEEPPPKPGQESRVVKRAYSIGCSILADDGLLFDMEHEDWLEFYVVLVRESSKEQPPALTPRLFTLKTGDRLFMGEKITGHYTLEGVQPDDTIVFLSTGTGEAPNDYMLWQLLKQNHQGRIVSACCVRYRRDLAYLEIHEKLMAQHPNYAYIPLTTREADTINRKVYIQELISSGQLEETISQVLDPERTHIYLCGNPSMIGVPVKDKATGQRTYPEPLGVVELLEKRGFHADQPNLKLRGNIHFEEYW